MPAQTAVAINAKGAVMSYQLEVNSPRPCWQTVRSHPQHFNKGYQIRIRTECHIIKHSTLSHTHKPLYLSIL